MNTSPSTLLPTRDSLRSLLYFIPPIFLPEKREIFVVSSKFALSALAPKLTERDSDWQKVLEEGEKQNLFTLSLPTERILSKILREAKKQKPKITKKSTINSYCGTTRGAAQT